MTHAHFGAEGNVDHHIAPHLITTPIPQTQKPDPAPQAAVFVVLDNLSRHAGLVIFKTRPAKNPALFGGSSLLDVAKRLRRDPGKAAADNTCTQW